MLMKKVTYIFYIISTIFITTTIMAYDVQKKGESLNPIVVAYFNKTEIAKEMLPNLTCLKENTFFHYEPTLLINENSLVELFFSGDLDILIVELEELSEINKQHITTFKTIDVGTSKYIINPKLISYITEKVEAALQSCNNKEQSVSEGVEQE